MKTLLLILVLCGSAMAQDTTHHYSNFVLKSVWQEPKLLDSAKIQYYWFTYLDQWGDTAHAPGWHFLKPDTCTVNWLGAIIYAGNKVHGWFTLYEDAEIGLRSDGVVVWRKQK